MKKIKFKMLMTIFVILISLLMTLPESLMAQDILSEQLTTDIITPEASLTAVSLTSSNNLVMGEAWYTIQLKTTTTGLIKYIEITFPSGFDLTGTKLLQATGIGAGNLTTSGQTLIYTVNSPANVSAQRIIKFIVNKIINGINLVNTVNVTTKNDLGVIIDGPTTSSEFYLTQVNTPMIGDDTVTGSKILDGSITTDDISNGSLSTSDLNFTPAIQADLETHKNSSDHDIRYFTESELSAPGIINSVGNPVDWTKLKGVPPGFADGLDDAGSGGPASDVVCSGCVDSSDIADGGIGSTDLSLGNYPNITGVGTLNSLSLNSSIQFKDGTTPLLINSETSGNRMLWVFNPSDTYSGIHFNDSSDLMSWRRFTKSIPPNPPYFDIMTVDFQNSRIGIRTNAPVAPLHIVGTTTSTTDNGLQIVASGWDASHALYGLTGDWYIRSGARTGKVVIQDKGGNVGIGTTNPLAKLDVAGTTRTQVLEITGGADLAEPFDIEISDLIQPGMVVSIDPDKPGNLKIADSSYDRTVAGIISGANEINPGLIMKQEGSSANGALPVALTGRVYAWADASYGSIQPGDLITTSDTPGHAMKVSDYNKAHGAIIGKAMSSLTEGKGFILVLVSLQ